MICKNCETDNPDGAIYCKNCGTRLDGKTVCPSCGKQTPDDGKFCMFCGSDISVEQQKAQKAAVNKPQNPEKAQKAEAVVKKVFNKTALVAALACVLFSLIFVFLIGVVLEVDYENAYLSSIKKAYGIKYFFGENFDNYRDTVKAIDVYNLTANQNSVMTHFPADAMLITCIFQTVILASTILAVIILSTVATIYTVRKLLGKGEKDGVKFAVAAYLVYVLGAVLLYSALNVDTDVEAVETSAELSGTTVAGLILGGISAAIAVICKTGEQGKELANTQTIIKYSFSLVGIILLAVVLGLCSAPAVRDTGDESGYLTFITGIAVLFSNKQDFQDTGSALGTVVLGTIAFALVCVIAACAVAAMVSHANKLQKGKSKTLPYTIATFASSIALLVVSVIMGNECNKAIEFIYDTTLISDFDYAIPIAILVISALALIANVAYLIVKNVTKQPEETQSAY